MTARAVAQDTNLSLDERGLLWYILSLPDDWVAHPMQLGKVNGIKSKTKIYGVFKRLMQAGYCERKDIRKDGRHETTIYMFYEDKQQRLIELYKDKPEEEQLPKKQEPELQDPKKQDPEKQDTTDNISIQKKKKKRNASLPSIEFDYETNEFVNIDEDDVLSWIDLYPGVDIKRELRLMRQWLMDPKNPERDGNRTFITNWLNKSFKDVKKSPKKPVTAGSNSEADVIPFNADIAQTYRDESEEAYVAYLQRITDKKHYQEYLKSKGL
jgi:hypothetical protein